MSINEYFAGNIYWPLAQKLKGEHVTEAFAKLSESQWMGTEELFNLQWALIKDRLNLASQAVPYYRKVFASIGWDFNKKKLSYEEFLKIPILEKEDVRDHLPELLNPNYNGRVTKGMTSGSTGHSLTLFYSSEHESFSEAARLRAKEWWGVKPGSAQVTIWGRPYTGRLDRFKQGLKSYLMNRLLFSAFDLNETALENMWQKIQRFKPSIIYGYPSAIFPLAAYLKEKKKNADKLNVKVIMITAESIPSVQKELIEEVFDCKTANEYGCSETGGFVYECPYGGWHISSEITFIEFLDHEGNPVPPGVTGEIFLTHLRNNYMPLIRYRVGDMGAYLAERCECGRGLPLMEVSVAKQSDQVKLSDGKSYSSEIFDYINLAVLNEFPASILQFRVIQKDYDLFEIEIIPGTIAVEKAEKLFEILIREQLGNNIHIKFIRTPEIKREVSGKLKYFISEVNSNHFM